MRHITQQTPVLLDFGAEFNFRTAAAKCLTTANRWLGLLNRPCAILTIPLWDKPPSCCSFQQRKPLANSKLALNSLCCNLLQLPDRNPPIPNITAKCVQTDSKENQEWR